MEFEEPRFDGMDVSNPKSLYELIVQDLCGERYFRAFDEALRPQIQEFVKMSGKGGLNYEQFNELLLLFDQDRVSKGFFDFFFSPNGALKLDEITHQTARFRGFAMLCFGDFRFAYKKLSRLNEDQLLQALHPYARTAESLKTSFSGRPTPALNIEKIAKDKSWCLGYISKSVYATEAKSLASLMAQGNTDNGLLKQAAYYQQLGRSIQESEAQGLRNTDTYLTWDYMDVYMATSMRRKWEFEETAEFVSKLFSSPAIRKLKLRYFDPTQSQCLSRIDKGLVEALMLKRAQCTVYMVQESDTMGKDSELASTLAQGKPVIAYVPKIKDVEAYAQKLHEYPLEFFKLRFQILQAEGILDDPKLLPELKLLEADFLKSVNDFITSLAAYRQEQPLTLWSEKDREFKAQSPLFALICRILATAEEFNFNKRANTLREIHPLSLQVHLEKGVANGVLVVRSVDECAEVLIKLLTNSLEFSVQQDELQKCTVLRETISESPFRAVSNYEKLANSFWNFYLSTDPRNIEGE